MRVLIAFLLVATALAGCSEDPVATTDPLAAPDLTTGPDTGAISGIVVSPTIVPVEGATVQLADATVITDADGIFAFTNLEPGVYFLDVFAPGHLTTQTSVEVAAGQVSKPRVMLAFDTSPQPYHQTTAFQGHIVLADAWAYFVYQIYFGNSDLCRCEFLADVGEDTETFVLEAIWDPSQPGADPNMYWEILGETSGHLESAHAANPILEHQPAAPYVDDVQAKIRFSVSTTVQVEQPFEVFFTTFHVAPAPEGWSLVAGD